MRSFGYDPASLRRFRKDDGGDLSRGTGAHHLDRLADFLCEANPELDRATALNWLMHHRAGRALAAFFNKHGAAATEKFFKQRKDPAMNDLHSIAKDYGVVKVAKYIVEHGGGSITEAEFTKLVTDFAPRNPGERADSAFARAFSAPTEDGATLRKAHAVIKNYPMTVTLTPLVTGGADALAAADEGTKAYGQLMELAEEQRKRSPTLTVAQAFAKVAADAANKELLAASILRSKARTTNVTGGIVG